MPNFKSVATELRKAANTYPGAYEESPWGELVVKVKGKVFVFIGKGEREVFGLSVKLPSSSGLALSFPFASPTGYGLGKSGWVSARFEKGQDVPTGLLLEWIDESYRAIAPKTLVKELGGGEKPSTSASAKKKPKAKAKKGTVLVVSDDDLRLERAKKAIAADKLGKFLGSGVDDAFETANKKKPSAVIVDLGRRAPAALELGIQLAHALGETPVVFAGARDAATVKKARKAADSVHAALREPPGDPKVIAELAAALG
ncbi:MAG: MmcQ/YjbR family DNA-binding protein [Planctomycetota bacterium]